MHPLLLSPEITTLEKALYFMKMEELKHACETLRLPTAGKKIALIHRIITFIKTGSVVNTPIIPPISRAISHTPQPLHPHSLMLYDTYKNDLITRTFFKKIIGDHFHFTAFGIDWLNEQWLNGTPPTYQEFAQYWITETARRKKTKANPKQEWAYINFLQDMTARNPNVSRDELIQAWKALQREQARKAQQLIQKAVIKK